MNAVELAGQRQILSDAIARLDTQREHASRGPWVSSYDWTLVGVDSSEPGIHVAFPGDVLRADAELIVTMHAAVDGVLTILRTAMDDSWGSPDEPGALENAVELAKSILAAKS